MYIGLYEKLIFILLVLCSIWLYVTGQETSRKKIGVVLSGGSAKGFAHVIASGNFWYGNYGEYGIISRSNCTL